MSPTSANENSGPATRSNDRAPKPSGFFLTRLLNGWAALGRRLFRAEPDPLSPRTYRRVIAAHLQAIEPKQQAIDNALVEAGGQGADEAVLVRLRLMKKILGSGLFDAEFYLDQYPDVRNDKADPLDHYVRHGEAEGRRPNAFFSPIKYRHAGAPGVPSECSALEHYIDEGERAGRSPGPAFDPSGYLGANPALARFVDRPLFHYLRIGRAANLNTGLAVQSDTKLDPTSSQAYQETLAEHLRQIAPRSEALDAALYEARERGAAANVISRLELTKTILASGLFDADFYLNEYPDIKRGSVDPLGHYVSHGETEGRRPNPFFSPNEYRKLSMPDAPAERSALEHYISDGERTGCKAGTGFDGAEYLRANPAIATFVDRPLFHYLKIGRAAGLKTPPPWRLGPAMDPLSPDTYRDAIDAHALHTAPARLQIEGEIRQAQRSGAAAEVSARLRVMKDILVSGLFDAELYLEENQDVRDDAADPLDHYVRFGEAEGRRPNALFSPAEYRHLSMQDAPAGRSALEHYINEGERASRLPGLAFDAASYLDANPALSAFVDRPLFHYLKIGHPARLDIRRIGKDYRRRSTANSDLRIAANLGVKDEAEIIERSIAHLREIGVDLIMVCDMSSTDGTAEILEKYRSDNFWVMTLNNETLSDRISFEKSWLHYNQERYRNAPADWVIFLDADEFWIPASGSLKDCEALRSADVVSVDRYNVPLGPHGPMAPETLRTTDYDDLLLIANGIPDFRNQLLGDLDAPWIMGAQEPKVMARPRKIGGLTHGLHDVIDTDAPVRKLTARDLFVAHLPLSTPTRFARKVENIKAYYRQEGIDVTSAGGSWQNRADAIGWHWRRWAAFTEDRQLAEEFGRNVFDAKLTSEMRKDGIIRSAGELLRQGLPERRQK